MTHPKRNFLEVTQILKDWVSDAEGMIRQSTNHKHFGNPVLREHVRELKLNLPKARKALRELTSRMASGQPK